MAEIYHILNRSTDKRKIFLDDKDYFRFIHDLFEFNDQLAAINTGFWFRQRQFSGLQSRYSRYFEQEEEREKRKFLVNILAFCLMPNHYHLLLTPVVEGGITDFMRKLNVGYAKYFNQKYKRVGVLFQSRYKSIIITQESHFIHLPYYIHLNPLDLEFSEWREGELKNYKEAMRFLEHYRWSSFLDYIGKSNFPSVTQREFLLEFLGGSEQYKKDTLDWLKGRGRFYIERVGDVILE